MSRIIMRNPKSVHLTVEPNEGVAFTLDDPWQCEVVIETSPSDDLMPCFTVTLTGVGPIMRDVHWVFTCYGNRSVDVFTTADLAKAAASEHLLGCPEGPCSPEWKIQWYYVAESDTWVSAGGSQWLSHHVQRWATPEVTD